MNRLILIAALVAVFSSALYAEVNFEGDIALGASYNSNLALISPDDRSTTGMRTSDIASFSLDLDAFLTLIPAEVFALEYTLFAAVPPHPATVGYSFFNHSLAALFSHEFEEVDISYGVELGHLLIGFNNRLLDPQILFDLFWYAHDNLSYYLTVAGTYVVSLDGEYAYLTAPGFRFENGIYIYPVAGNRSFISLGVGERLFFFGEDAFETPDLITVTARRDSAETYVRLKGKYFYEGFGIEASLRYGFVQYMGADEWIEGGDALYSKVRVDHTLRTKATLEYRFTDLFSMQAYYSYLRAFSNIGDEAADYENDDYDQHASGLMFRFVF